MVADVIAVFCNPIEHFKGCRLIILHGDHHIVDTKNLLMVKMPDIISQELSMHSR